MPKGKEKKTRTRTHIGRFIIDKVRSTVSWKGPHGMEHWDEYWHIRDGNVIKQTVYFAIWKFRGRPDLKAKSEVYITRPVSRGWDKHHTRKAAAARSRINRAQKSLKAHLKKGKSPTSWRPPKR